MSGAAGALAGAATRSLIDGTDFGDNILATLPDVIGSTIGNAIGAKIAAQTADKRSNSDLGELRLKKGGLLNSVGDFLGFDGEFGYQGNLGRTQSLDGLTRAFKPGQSGLTGVKIPYSHVEVSLLPLIPGQESYGRPTWNPRL